MSPITNLRLCADQSPALAKPSLTRKVRDRLLVLLGRLANRVGLPGLVGEHEIDDAFAGKVSIRTSPWFTVISINGRDLYFRRWSGKFDGTGSMVGGCEAG